MKKGKYITIIGNGKKREKVECELKERHGVKFYLWYGLDIIGKVDYTKPIHVFISRKDSLRDWVIDDAKSIVSEINYNHNLKFRSISVKNVIGYYCLYFDLESYYNFDKDLYLKGCE